MINLESTIVDCHGIQYAAPIIHVAQATYSGNSSIDIAANGDSHIKRHSNETHNLSYQAFIWIDAAAKAAGLKPLLLKDKNGNDWHTLSLTEPLANETSIIEQCEQHILTTIIPQLTPAIAQE